jgi:HCOMODA/2-hydroxy-3-carboxy-muconic semialdehyde decarboxylase
VGDVPELRVPGSLEDGRVQALREERLRVTHEGVSGGRKTFILEPFTLLVYKKGLKKDGIAILLRETLRPLELPVDKIIPDPDVQRKADLVTAYKILVNEGILDSFGHVTVRSAKDPNVFYMPRAMPPALVTAKDIVELDLDSVPIDANAPRTNGERFIHGEIYRIRPDVQAIVHSHSPAVIPFSISPDRPLRPVLHMAGFLPARVSVFDHRDVSKDDPSLRGKLMVNNAKLGAALARTLGGDSVVLIRGHGNAVVGASLPWAVFRAVYTHLNARTQMEAITLGADVIYLNEDELKMHTVEVFDVERPWQNLKSRLPKTP